MQFGSLLLGTGTPYGISSLTGAADMPDVVTGDVQMLLAHGMAAGADTLSNRVIQLTTDVTQYGTTSLTAAIAAFKAAIQTSASQSPLAVKIPTVADGRTVYCNARARKRVIPTDHNTSTGIAPSCSAEWAATDPRWYDVNSTTVTGNTTFLGNLLSAPDSSAAWWEVVGANTFTTSAASYTAYTYNGSFISPFPSVPAPTGNVMWGLTATTTSAAFITTDPVAITAGQTVTGMIQALRDGGASGSTLLLNMSFYNASSTFISGISTTFTDNSSTWTAATVHGVAPAGATSVNIQLEISGPHAGDTHYFDELGIFVGSAVYSGAWYPGNFSTVSLTCTNAGDISTPPVFNIGPGTSAGAAVPVSISNGTSSINFNGQIGVQPAGTNQSIVTLDERARSAVVTQAGVSSDIYSYITSSSWWELPPGASTVTFLVGGVGVSSGVPCSVTFSSAWA